MLEKVDGALLRLVHMSIGLLGSAHAKTASMHEERCLAFVGNLSEKMTDMDYILYIYASACTTEEMTSSWLQSSCLCQNWVIGDVNRSI